jgi:deoxyguanosine kinase
MNKTPYNFIAIEGNIGAGKTTLSTLFSQDFSGKLILEEFENNPFLEAFYSDPERYAFQVELTFLADRYRQLREKLKSIDLFEPTVFSDYFIMKSLIFAQVTLKEHELELYEKFFDITAYNLPMPDLLIYLYLDVDGLQRNIAKRGRHFEQEINPEYLNSLQNRYLEYLKAQQRFPCLIVDTNGLDFVKNSQDYNWLKGLVCMEYPKGVHYLRGK